ncbi:MAG: zinc-ribbon domain-containing protein, partial [Jannaschia sp.]
MSAPMRLTCPDCSAQYEVSPELIPPEGREVQCSGCGATWVHPGTEAEEDLEAVSDPAPPVADMRRPRPPADDAVLDILRAERDHETRLRAAGSDPDTGMSEPESGDVGTAPQGEGSPEDAARVAAAAERARMAAAASIGRARTGQPGT